LLKRLFSTAILFFFVLVSYQNCSNGFKAVTGGAGALNSSEQFAAVESAAKTLLANQCISCHGAVGLGGLSNILDTNSLISGGFVIPGNPAGSSLYQVMQAGRMPPAGPLAAQSQRIIADWITLLGGGSLDSQDPVQVYMEFNMTPSLEPLLFQVRLGKVANSLNVAEIHTALGPLRNNRFLLGDYDFANAVSPRTTWESSDMGRWLENIQPACSGTRPSNPWPAAATNLFTRAYGRAMSPADTMIMNDLDRLSIPGEEKYEILCMVLLSSMEFVAK
jgi:mono/diheme cytochrome c family protein